MSMLFHSDALSGFFLRSNRKILFKPMKTSLDSFVSNGPNIANMSTYSAAKGWSSSSKPPVLPRLAMIMENSPRETIVNPIFAEALGERPALFPASIPARKLPNSVMATAPSESHTAPPSASGSIVKPKLKKKTAPKKSRNGNMRCSMRFICSVSARTSPTRSAPIASAT